VVGWGTGPDREITVEGAHDRLAAIEHTTPISLMTINSALPVPL